MVGAPPRGCEHCWAEGMSARFSKLHDTTWNTVLTRPDRLDAPIKKKKPTTFAVSLLGDLFHPEVPKDFLVRVGNIIARAEQHKFIIPTKRYRRAAATFMGTNPGDNFIVMASVWDQESCDRACEELSGTPVKWGLNFEPLLGSVHLSLQLSGGLSPLWIIIGSENGHRARPMEEKWAARLLAETTGIPFWYKGNSRLPKNERYLLNNKAWMEVPW